MARNVRFGLSASKAVCLQAPARRALRKMPVSRVRVATLNSPAASDVSRTTCG